MSAVKINAEPSWVEYSVCQDGYSDKFYECRVDPDPEAPGMWTLTKRWGRNPDAGGGQVKAEMFGTRESAVRAGRVQMEKKRGSGGYVEAPRPEGAAGLPDLSDPKAIARWLDE